VSPGLALSVPYVPSAMATERRSGGDGSRPVTVNAMLLEVWPQVVTQTSPSAVVPRVNQPLGTLTLTCVAVGVPTMVAARPLKLTAGCQLWSTKPAPLTVIVVPSPPDGADRLDTCGAGPRTTVTSVLAVPPGAVASAAQTACTK